MKRVLLFVILIVEYSSIIGQSKGIFVDVRDNRNYKWVKIGEQVWMAENLAFLPEITNPKDGLIEPDTYTVYDYIGTDIAGAKQTENYKTFGVLYNWNSAYDACPAGWHLPSSDEWNLLAGYVVTVFGGSYDTRGFWLNIGETLKSKGTIVTGDGLWKYKYETITGQDLFGFNGVPGGRLSGTTFSSKGEMGIWWSADEDVKNASKAVALNYATKMFYFSAYDRKNGLSIRCVRDK